jgi:hypothetical protein
MANKKKLKSLIIFSLICLLLAGAGLVMRNFILRQITKRIESSFHYSRLRLSVLPAAIILEDVRTVAASPFFSAEEIRIQMSYFSLFRGDKTFRVMIDKPVVRIYEAAQKGSQAGLKLNFPFPFSVESGFIRGGEFYFWGRGISVAAKGIRGMVRQKRDAFTLRLESAENSVLLSTLKYPLTGKVRVFCEGKGSEVIFRRVDVESQGYILRAKGKLSNPGDPQFEIQTGLHLPAKLIADLAHIPFRWDGKVEGHGLLARRAGRLSFESDLASDRLLMNSVSLGRVEGKISLSGGGGRVDLRAQRGAGSPESIDIAFGKGRVEGRAEGIHLEPIVKELALPWPVRSAAWGGFVVEKGELRVNAEFRDDLLTYEPGKYPFRGPVVLTWDGKRKVTFSSQGLESNFGTLSAEGDIEIGGTLSVALRGNVKDVEQGRKFTELVLQKPIPIPEIRGSGTAEIKILGSYFRPQVRIDFSLARGGFDRFDASSVGGLVEIVAGEATGMIKIQDPDMRGDIRFDTKADTVNAGIRAEGARLEKILPALRIGIPLSGRASGNLEVDGRGAALHVKGDITSAEAELAGQPFRDVKSSLEWTPEGETIVLHSLEAVYRGAKVSGDGTIGFGEGTFDINFRAEHLALSSLSPDLGGSASLDLKGRGSLKSDRAAGRFSITDFRYARMTPVALSGRVEIAFPNKHVNISLDGEIESGQNPFSASVLYPGAEKGFEFYLKGHLASLDLLVPWEGAQGEIDYQAEIKGASDGPRVNGIVDFKGSIFPFPDFAQALTDYSGLVFIQNNIASIRSLRGKLGGGEVFGSGEIRLGQKGLESVDVRAEGKDMVLSVFERTRALVDGSARLLKDAAHFSLSGDFLVKSLIWRREISEKLIFSQTPFPEAKKKPGIFDGLALDIRLHAEDNARLDNSLGQVQGRFDLTIGGTVDSPAILGDIEGLRGEVNFQDRKFQVLKARLSFFNPTSVAPYLDFLGETYLKDYRVTFSLTGLIDRLRPEFSSSPPLPPEDVLALLALGESFKRTYSYDTSSRLSTGSLLSFELAEETKKRAERLFSLDRFRIDPFVLGASTEMTARLTVGKKISRNVMLLYSTNLTTQREEIVRMEWEFGESFSLVGMRDERGRISIDAKIRKRF